MLDEAVRRGEKRREREEKENSSAEQIGCGRRERSRVDK